MDEAQYDARTSKLAEQRARIRTLEGALRPFAWEATEFEHRLDPDPDLADEPECMNCGDPWPCKYETARRALEGAG